VPVGAAGPNWSQSAKPAQANPAGFAYCSFLSGA
jgi:hypothetical protein